MKFMTFLLFVILISFSANIVTMSGIIPTQDLTPGTTAKSDPTTSILNSNNISLAFKPGTLENSIINTLPERGAPNSETGDLGDDAFAQIRFLYYGVGAFTDIFWNSVVRFDLTYDMLTSFDKSEAMPVTTIEFESACIGTNQIWYGDRCYDVSKKLSTSLKPFFVFGYYFLWVLAILQIILSRSFKDMT